MKSKKGAFINTSTGYGKRHNSSTSHKSFNKSVKSNETSSSSNSNSNNINNRKVKKVEPEAEKPKIIDDTDLNSGFGNYLRSNQGIEMMKIFVFANTVMVLVTMAWPHVREQYIWLMEWLDSFK